MNLGPAVKQLRLEKNMSQIEVSKKANIAQGKISTIEQGKYPDLDENTLRPILDAIGVSYLEVVAKAQTADQVESQLDRIEKMLKEVHEAIFAGNGEVKEFRIVYPRRSTEMIPLSVEFEPVLTIQLWEDVGTARKDDILVFAPYDDEFVDKEAIYVVETKAKKPWIFLGGDYNPEKDPPIEGKAVRKTSRL